jgi:hypothetical protein
MGDAKAALIAAKAETFKAYILWRVKLSRIKKESSIITYWLNLSMVYAESAKRWMDESILYDIRNVCHSPPLNLNDVYNMIVDPGIRHTSVRA